MTSTSTNKGIWTEYFAQLPVSSLLWDRHLSWNECKRDSKLAREVIKACFNTYVIVPEAQKQQEIAIEVRDNRNQPRLFCVSLGTFPAGEMPTYDMAWDKLKETITLLHNARDIKADIRKRRL
ncbi:hypothetical protein ETB97_006811 [Aspergillus alliaceus]|uniref:Uncharacterized protein n=1 Tax=Petromyces alliaceus TaxID=209559 RepID=A0A8H6AGA5_PETAA|nr:hypothetical protein ETB97_006811 [Aspergillus burnettii]